MSLPPRTPSTSVASAAAASSSSIYNNNINLNPASASAANFAATTTTTPYISPARTTHFKPSVLTSDVHNEAEIIFHILEHREKKCVSKLDMLTLLRGMGMNPTDGDLESLHASMQPLIEEYEDMVREEEKRKERERKKLEAMKGGPKTTNPVKDKAEREKKKLEAMRNSARGSGRSRPSTAATGDSSQKDGETGSGGKDGDKKKPKTDPPEEIKNIDWHIFMHCVEPVFKDSRQEEKELLEAFRIFDPDGYGKMPMSKLIDIATQHGESVLSPAEVKLLRESLPGELIEFKQFTKKLLGTWVPPPPPTQEEIAARAKAAAEEAKRRREAEANDIDKLLTGTAGSSSSGSAIVDSTAGGNGASPSPENNNAAASSSGGGDTATTS